VNVEDKPIGFFDSGVGGLSVLREAVKLLPGEDFIYFGDSKNAPYGIKDVDEVKALTFNAVDFLIKKKALIKLRPLINLFFLFAKVKSAEQL